MRSGSTLVVTFDGLRRDRATPELMPNLARFMAEGTDFTLSRSVFPSETRVCISSLVTGCPPGTHGIVANEFIHRAVVQGRTFNTARQEDLRAADAAGLLLDQASLGERLAAAGEAMAVVSTGTPGATLLMDHRAAALGHFVFSAHGPSASVPPEAAEAVIRHFGPVPQGATPNTARLDYAARVLTEHVYPALRPALAILWFSDPDSTSHRFGVLAAETAESQAGADRAFGAVLDWWRASPENRPENILVMSDHGQITGREEVDVAALLPDLAGELVPGYVSSVHFHAPSQVRQAALVERLSQAPWCGLIFTPGGDGRAGAIPGTFDLNAVGGGHARAADVVFTLAADRNPGDPAGSCLFSRSIEPGGGIHGGVQRGELSTVLAGAGPAFARARRTSLPCWLPDIAPTLLHMLGLPGDGMVGRVLSEGLAAPAGEPPAFTPRTLEAQAGPHRQALHQWVRDGVAITDHGWSSHAG